MVTRLAMDPWEHDLLLEPRTYCLKCNRLVWNVQRTDGTWLEMHVHLDDTDAHEHPAWAKPSTHSGNDTECISAGQTP